MRIKALLILMTTVSVLLSGMMTAFAASSTEGKQGLMTLGHQAPDFILTDVVTGQTVALNDFKDKKGLLVMILCRHCPYVQHVKQGVSEMAKEYQGKGIAMVAISANDSKAVPSDAPESLKEMALQADFTFPFLFDETQKVAQAYTAVATPDFFLFDENRQLVYRGQFDNSRPGGTTPVTGSDIRSAIDALLEGNPISPDQKPAVGCSIKWKPGNKPAYT
ncbi:MAG TPA: thioredoxin family protein [bacterium]|nr:thioredoxin family protein [bacterium]